MKYKIEFGFGIGEDCNGKPIEPTRSVIALNNIRRAAAKFFGGYTMYPTVGGWINEGGRLVEEPGYTLFVFGNTIAKQAEISEMVALIKQELTQQAVAVTTTLVNSEIV